MIPLDKNQITAVILAGGQGRRLGGQDKGLVEFNKHTLVEYVIKAIRPQVKTILIIANRHQANYADYGYPVLADQLKGYQGPLAGFASGMHVATTSYIVTVPCDGPFLASDLVTRLATALVRDNAELAVAHDGKRLQPVYALLAARLLPDLKDYLATGNRKIDLWYARYNIALADFSDSAQSFRNINTPEDQRNFHKNLQKKGPAT